MQLSNLVVCDDVEQTWADLGLAGGLPEPAVLLARSHREALAAVRWHVQTLGELLIAGPTRVDDEMLGDLRRAGFHVVGAGEPGAVVPPSTRHRPEQGRLWLLTSGSTGRPKRVAHTLGSLVTTRGAQRDRTWLCPYAVGTYAWWQVVSLCLTHPRQKLVTVEPGQVPEWPTLAGRHGVTAVSGTPTFWRQSFHRDPRALAGLPLQQITLGGEPVDQAILDLLARTFPAARISWIYASTEVGACIVVHDGSAGFPADWLGRRVPGRPVLQVDDGELVITSPHHGAGLDGPVRTGDRVEVAGGRVFIAGRIASDEINVGGAKVSAALVRDVLQAHPGVVWARVSGRRAPLVGHVVVADVVPAANGVLPRVDETALTAWCSARLPAYALPRRIRFLAAVPMKETLKSDG